MYCPKCGTQIIGENKFCRGCGTNLIPVTLLVKGQNWVEAAQKDANFATNISSNKFFQCGISILFMGLFTTIIFGSLELNKIAGIGSAFIIAGAGILAYPWLPGVMNKEFGKYCSKSLTPPDSPVNNKRFKTSEMKAVPPSITEHTTHKLDESKYKEKILS